MMLYSKEGLETQFLAWAASLAKDELQLFGLKNKLESGDTLTHLSKQLGAIKVEVYDSIESARDAFSFNNDANLFNAIYKQIVEYVEHLLAVASHISMPQIEQVKKAA